jgi:hypothetical protein
MSFDVFKEAEFWSKNPNSVCNEWPEVSRIVCAESFSCCTEGLTRVAPSDDVHAVTKV